MPKTKDKKQNITFFSSDHPYNPEVEAKIAALSAEEWEELDKIASDALNKLNLKHKEVSRE